MSKIAAERCEDLLLRQFGQGPGAVGSAPGRVNLIGEHTDYNDGFVLPMALERRTGVALCPSPDCRWRFVSEHDDTVVEFSDEEAMQVGRRDWTSYCRGVAAGFRSAGHTVPPLCIAVASDVPLGGGLSSSAALEVSVASAIEGLIGVPIEPVTKALLCQKAEHEFAGVPCGYMDQAISVMGRADHALLIDCRSLEATLVPVSDGSVSVLIVNSMVRHELSGGEYAQRRAQCERAVKDIARVDGAVSSLRDVSLDLLATVRPHVEPIAWRRARHVAGEIARTLKAAVALRAGDYAGFGRLMDESHASLRDDYEVSCKELDLLVEIARCQCGVLGARMTGGGFGGCIVSLVASEHASTAGHAIAASYFAQTGVRPDWFVTRAGDGARTERAAH
ncbi:MAG: galactokinase [Phycisphaerales bacterium]|nr:galactokinase [Phycisphaerales bacterium]